MIARAPLRARAIATWKRWPAPPTPYIQRELDEFTRARAPCR